ncbi:MAG TPA: hypothetical protein VNS58_12940 [Puia sp.]|nr:hypothetical protein [Puia sp.]
MKFISLLLFTFFFFPYGKRPAISTLKRQAEVFPNEVGDHWTYQFRGYGSSADKIDSINVDIIGQILLPDGGHARIWLYRYPNGVDTNYVVSDEKMVKIYYGYYNYCNPCTGIMPREKFKYSFPLEMGKSWITGDQYGDTIKAISKSSVTVPAGTFLNTSLLINLPGKSKFIGNFHRKDSIWYTPYIGVIKRRQNEFDLRPMPGNGIWELSGYSLK